MYVMIFVTISRLLLLEFLMQIPVSNDEKYTYTYMRMHIYVYVYKYTKI